MWCCYKNPLRFFETSKAATNGGLYWRYFEREGIFFWRLSPFTEKNTWGDKVTCKLIQNSRRTVSHSFPISRICRGMTRGKQIYPLLAGKRLSHSTSASKDSVTPAKFRPLAYDITLMTTLGGRYTDKETETYGGEVICSLSHYQPSEWEASIPIRVWL